MVNGQWLPVCLCEWHKYQVVHGYTQFPEPIFTAYKREIIFYSSPYIVGGSLGMLHCLGNAGSLSGAVATGRVRATITALTERLHTKESRAKAIPSGKPARARTASRAAVSPSLFALVAHVIVCSTTPDLSVNTQQPLHPSTPPPLRPLRLRAPSRPPTPPSPPQTPPVPSPLLHVRSPVLACWSSTPPSTLVHPIHR